MNSDNRYVFLYRPLHSLESGGRSRIWERLNNIGGSGDFFLRVRILINQVSLFVPYEICQILPAFNQYQRFFQYIYLSTYKIRGSGSDSLSWTKASQKATNSLPQICHLHVIANYANFHPNLNGGAQTSTPTYMVAHLVFSFLYEEFENPTK